MRSYKRIFAGIAALGMAFGMAACGSGDDNNNSGGAATSEDESFEVTENVEVKETTEVTPIPEGANSTILYLGEGDINPTRANPEKSVEITLFEQMGGKVEFKATSNEKRFDDLAMLISANQDIPDIFKYEWLAFPSQVVRNMYQPIDEIVDFESPMWEDTKETADQFMLGGEHYVAPLGYVASAMICYDADVIEDEGLDDPYELYKKGEWNWDAWEEIMREYVSNAPADTQRYGINGFFKQHVTQQTGKNLIVYDSATNTFSSNLMDPDIEEAQNLLYELGKDGIILNGWIGSADECFTQNCLFYGMGEWAYTGNSGPTEKDNWAIVPMPQYTKNPQKITTSDMTAYMWVKGSNNPDAVKTWFECNRIAKLDPDYVDAAKLKFFENNPNWTEEMYEVKMDVVSDDYLMIFDYAFGLSSRMGDRSEFDGNQCLTDYLYNGSSTQDEEGTQQTWAAIRESYTATVDQEVKDLNAKVAELN